MLSVLIVDDEEWIRLGIASKLRKSQYNFQEILQEQSAEQALVTASAKHPDIVLCDIHMDGMNGLVFSSKLLELLPDTKIIIISGYNDFSYAKEAIRLGVVDYLLKPIDNAGLNQALEKCIFQINQDQIHHNALEAMKKVNQRKTLRSTAVDILTQTAPDYSRLFCAYTGSGSFQAYYLYLDVSCSLSLDILDDHIARHFPGFILGENLIYYENRYHEFLIALYFPQKTDEIKGNTFIRMLEASLRAEISSLMPYQYTFGISGVRSDLNTAIREAILCMKHRILCSGKSMIYPSDIAGFTSGKIDLSFLSDLNETISHKDQRRLDSVLKSMYGSIEKSSLSYEALQNLYLKILVLLGDHSVLHMTPFPQMPSEVYHFSSIWDWIDFLRELLTHFFENTESLSIEKDPRIALIGEIQAYIQENFSTKISLGEIAHQKHMNYCYLSLLFKEVAEVSFQDYLMDIRLKYACRLLQTGEYKIKDVAELSGFSDQHYFSKTFKKSIGCSPKKYQQNMIGRPLSPAPHQKTASTYE